MPHIHNEPGQHDLTVSAFILNRQGHILVHKHKRLNRYMQPGGHVELHEDPWTALLREIKEETGYTPEQLFLKVPPMAMIDNFVADPKCFHPYPISFNTHPIGDDGHYHTDLGYAFKIFDSKPYTEPAEGESRDILWIDRFNIDNVAYNIPRNVQTIMKYVTTDVMKEWPVFAVSFLEDLSDEHS